MPIANWSGNLGPCRLIRHTGETWDYASLDALVQANRNILINNMLSDRPPLLRGKKPKNEYVRVDDHWAYRTRMMQQYGYDPFAPWERPWYVVVDELDLIVPPWKVMERAYQLRVFDRTHWYWGYRVKGKRTYVFRQGVVPGTGHSGGRYYCWYRKSNHVMVDIRQNAWDACDEDLEDYPQLRLRDRDLPIDSWDRHRNKPRKSWKNHRKTQYRST